jgi:hypothetical protein
MDVPVLHELRVLIESVQHLQGNAENPLWEGAKEGRRARRLTSLV